MIELVVNGETRQVETGTTLAGLLEQLGYPRRGLAVAVGDEVVPRSGWTAHVLVDGERVDVITVAQGG